VIDADYCKDTANAAISLLNCDVDKSQPIVAPPAPAGRLPPSFFNCGHKSRALREEWRRTAWSRRTAGWMLLSTVLIWGAAGGSWVFYFLTPKAAPVAFDGDKTLREATQAWVGQGVRPNYDQLNLFLNAMLPALYQFTPDGAAFRPFIKGMVAPDLIAAADTAFTRNLEAVRKKGICQAFRLSDVDPDKLVFDADSKRVSVLVRGVFEISFQQEPARGLVRIPYAAKIILTPNTPSAVNPFSFYIEEIDQADNTPLPR
jgi:hypothetical protein